MNKIIKTILLLIIIFTLIGCSNKKKEVLVNGINEIIIDGIRYNNTDEIVNVEPKENIIKHIEASTGTSPVIKAYAIIQNNQLVYCYIDENWYKFQVYISE